jgi:stage V sporulation protein G
MKITDVRIRQVDKEDSKLKAIASVTIEECFVVHDIKIIQGESSMFIAMPSRKTKEGEYKDIAHPINSETRNEMSDVILKAYDEALKVEA